MSPELARLALIFLGRVDLKGTEAATFLEVVRALEAIVKVQAGD